MMWLLTPLQLVVFIGFIQKSRGMERHGGRGHAGHRRSGCGKARRQEDSA